MGKRAPNCKRDRNHNMDNSGIRERQVASNGELKTNTVTKETLKSRPADEEEQVKLTLLDVIRIVLGLILLNCSMSYFITKDTWLWGWRPWFLDQQQVMRYMRGPLLLTDAELAHYDGSDPTLPIYLGLNGTIYDVTAGRRIYGPGGMYNILAGKDAARAYVTGCFAEDGTPDLRGVEWMYVPVDVPDITVKVDREMKSYRSEELRKGRKAVKEAIDGWVEMFSGRKGKDYFEVGRIVREEGWLEKLPVRNLCDSAEKKRPASKRKEDRKVT